MARTWRGMSQACQRNRAAKTAAGTKYPAETITPVMTKPVTRTALTMPAPRRRAVMRRGETGWKTIPSGAKGSPPAGGLGTGSAPLPGVGAGAAA